MSQWEIFLKWLLIGLWIEILTFAAFTIFFLGTVDTRWYHIVGISLLALFGFRASQWNVLHLKLCKKYRRSTYLLYSSVIFLKQLGTYMTSIFKNDTDSCFQLSMQRSWDSKYSNIIVIFSTILFKKKKISLFRPLFPYTSFANCKNALKTFQKLNWRCLWCR